jgi:3-oxoacyl-[acyl-carrier-protein] synthase II
VQTQVPDKNIILWEGFCPTHIRVQEEDVIKATFGEHAKKLAMSSTKGMTGHLIGAAGAVEAVVCVMALQEQFYPATINLTTPDPELDLDYVPNQGRVGKMEYAMSNSLGFGGHNGILIFKKFNA